MPSDTPPATPEHAVGGGGSKVCITALYAKPSPVNPGPARWRLQGVCQELCAKHIPSHKPWSCSSTLALVILRIGPSPAHEPCVVIWHPSLPLKLAHMPGPEHRTCSSSPAAHSPLYPPLPPPPRCLPGPCASRARRRCRGCWTCWSITRRLLLLLLPRRLGRERRRGREPFKRGRRPLLPLSWSGEGEGAV